MAYSGAARQISGNAGIENMSAGRYRGFREKPAETETRKTTVINIGKVDYASVFIITLLVLLGIVMVFTSSIYIAENAYGDMFHFLKRQVIFAVIGFAAMFFMSNFSYRYLMKFAVPLYLISNALLIAVQLIGLAYGGATRQIEVPYIGQFQPFEVAKVSIIILMSYIIHRNRDLLKRWSGFFICCGIVLITTALVFLGGLSSAIITAIIGFGIIFIASPHIWRFIVLGVAGMTGVGCVIAMASQFRIDRITAWLDPFADTQDIGFQIVQSLFAIASGGIFGLGIGQSRQRSFLPLAHNDFIFAIICEELGLLGAGVVLVLFGMLIWRGINIAIKAPDMFSSLLASGIVLLIGSQVIINVAVVTNSIPNTGITMPLVSYGGTSFLITMFLLGVLLNISRHSKG